MESSDIDRFIANTPIIAPPGGEIVVESAETFDYPAEPQSEEELVELRHALGRVLEHYAGMGSEDLERLVSLDADLDGLLGDAATEALSDDAIMQKITAYILDGNVSRNPDS